MKTALQILTHAKEVLTPESWFQNGFDGGLTTPQKEGVDGSCLALALGAYYKEEATNWYLPGQESERAKASFAVLRALGSPNPKAPDHGPMWKFNDAPGRTLEEVHAKIDEAITLLKADS